jgi:hypothetical protein
LSKNTGSIINGKYSSVSQQRAKASIVTGIAPPYRLSVVRRGMLDDSQSMTEETTIIEIDGEYTQRTISKEIVKMDDLLAEFLD